MIGVSIGIIELRGRYGIAQLRADAPADLVARLRELLEGADGAGDPGRGAVRADGGPGRGAVRNGDPGPTARSSCSLFSPCPLISVNVVA